MRSGTLQLSVVASAIAGDLKSAPRVARVMGFSGVQLPLEWAGVNLAKLSGSGQREVRQLLGAHEQQLVSIQVDLGTHGLGPSADVDQQLSRLDDAMKAARGLGAGVVCVDLGDLPQPAAEAKPAPRVTPAMAGLIILPGTDVVAAAGNDAAAIAATTDPALFSAVDAALFELGRRADRASVILAMRSDLSSMAALARALRSADCPWFGIDLDPVAILRDAWHADEIFSRLGGQTRHVRVRDAVRGASGRTRPAIVGQGSTNWPELLARLDDSEYHGWLSIDPTELPDRPAAAIAALTLLRAVK